MDNHLFEQAAEMIQGAEAMIITAGAGIGVDSGLPDFRGNTGFWKAYKPYEKLGIGFADAANPTHFRNDPAFGWGFYGHRTNLYRRTIPHAGFQVLRSWMERFERPGFVITSNVDGQFQKAGFDEDRMLEVHGSIHWLQCLSPCSPKLWPNNETIEVDEIDMRTPNIPVCPHCGGVSRPNILMFNDFSWISKRTDNQQAAFNRFIKQQRGKQIVIVEIGAGTSVNRIRYTSETIAGNSSRIRIIRLNLNEPDIRPPHLGLPCGALDGLRKIDSLMV